MLYRQLDIIEFRKNGIEPRQDIFDDLGKKEKDKKDNKDNKKDNKNNNDDSNGSKDSNGNISQY